MKKSKSTERQPFLRFLFVLYCAAMLWLLFGRSRGWVAGLSYREQIKGSINLIPFYTIRNYLYVIIHRSNDSVLVHCIINLVGNVVLFIPAGYLLPKLFPKQRNYFRFFLTCTGSMLLVELLQLFTLLGSFDVDDLILNLFGMTIGFLIYTIFTPRKKKRKKS